MTLAETTKFMERIKNHYQEFVIDKIKIKEWHNQLQDYSYEDVNRKLDEHLNNETYGWNIPKINFLTKYLQKENEPKVEYSLECPLCREFVKGNEFDEHYSRCSSVNYLNKQSLKITGKPLDKKKLFSMSKEEFDNYYNRVLEVVLKNSESNSEKKIINHILNGAELNFKEIKFDI